MVKVYVTVYESPDDMVCAPVRDRSMADPPPTAACVMGQNSLSVTAASGAKATTMRYWLAAGWEMVPVGRTLSVAYCVVNSVTRAMSPAASPVDPLPKAPKLNRSSAGEAPLSQASIRSATSTSVTTRRLVTPNTVVTPVL